jgi:hypothetical protein
MLDASDRITRLLLDFLDDVSAGAAQRDVPVS